MKRVAKGNNWRIVIYTTNGISYLHFYGAKLIARLRELNVSITNKHYTNGVEYIQVKASELTAPVIDSLKSITFTQE